MIHHVRQTLFGGIDGSRRKCAFAKEKVQDGPEYQRKI
jgi:hypothetical protein